MVDVPDRTEHDDLAARVTAAEYHLDSLDAEAGAVDRMLDAHATAIDDLTRRVAALEQAVQPLPLVQPFTAQGLLDRMGVNAHPRWATPPDGHTETHLQLLAGLGVPMFRDRIGGPVNAAGLQLLEQLAGLGLYGHATVGLVSDTEAQVRQAAAWVRAHAELFASAGGVNEPNATGAGWAGRTLARQRWLFAELADTLPVCGPALKDNVADVIADFALLAAAGVADAAHYADFHRYPRGIRPTNGLAERQAAAVAAFGGKPTYLTEIGYNTSASSTGIAEDVAAVYAPRAYLDAFSAGIERVFTFELLDREEDPAIHAGHFGLVACPDIDDPATWRPKPSYTAVQALARFLADPGPDHTPDPVRVTVDGPADLRWLTAARRDGTAHAVLWRDVNAGAAPAQVTVTSNRGAETVALSDRWTAVRVR